MARRCHGNSLDSILGNAIDDEPVAVLTWAHVQIFLPKAVAAFFHRHETRVPITGDPGDYDSFCCRTAETKKY